MRIVKAISGRPIVLGYEGENEATQVQIDIVKSWTDLYGEGGTFTVLMQRPRAEESYPKVTEIQDGSVCFTADAADLVYPGMGAVIVRYMVGDTIAKSEIYSTRIRGSIGAEGETPEPYQAWVDEVLSASANVDEAVERAETAQRGAEEAEQNAETSAENASTSATNASTSATNALTAATSASTSATNAEASAKRAEEAAETVQNKLTPIHLYYDDVLNVIKDKDGNTLNYQQIYDLTTQGNTQVTVNYSDFIYRLVGYYGNAIEFTNAYLYEGREWSGRIIINSANAVRFDEVPNVHDIRINGQSIVQSGVADIPLANNYDTGLFTPSSTYGTVAGTRGRVVCIVSSAEEYKTASTQRFIAKGTLDNVLATPSIMPELTEAEQLAARQRIGIGGDFELIETIPLSGTLTISREMEPDGTPYKFKDFIIRCFLKQGSASPNVLINDKVICFYPSATGSDRYAKTRSFVLNKNIVSLTVANVTSFGAQGNVVATPVAIDNQTNYITKFSTYTANYTEGSYFEIYGVRA